MGLGRDDRLKAVFTALQALPLIRFALMLGGGVVATGGAAWVLWLVGHGLWPTGEPVAIARINALMGLGMASMTIIVVVMFALAFGKISDLSITTPAGSMSMKVDDDEPAPPAQTMTMSATLTPTQPAAPIGDA